MTHIAHAEIMPMLLFVPLRLFRAKNAVTGAGVIAGRLKLLYASECEDVSKVDLSSRGSDLKVPSDVGENKINKKRGCFHLLRQPQH
jgi:hypothetical protein